MDTVIKSETVEYEVLSALFVIFDKDDNAVFVNQRIVMCDDEKIAADQLREVTKMFPEGAPFRTVTFRRVDA